MLSNAKSVSGGKKIEEIKTMDKKTFERDIKKVVEISKEYGAEKVILFGSCVKDIETAHDIDIAVSGIKPEKFFYYYGRVASEAGDEIEIVDLADIREHFYKRILSKGKVIYERSV